MDKGPKSDAKKFRAKASKAFSLFAALCKRPFSKTFPKAFEGDFYISDLHAASKARKPWVNFLVIGVVLSVVADWYLLQNTFNIALEDEMKLFGFLPLFSTFIAICLLFSYLTLGYLAGKNYRERRAFGKSSSLRAVLTFGFLDLIVLAFLFCFRLYGEVEKNGGFGGTGLGLGFGGGGQEGTFQLGGDASYSGLSGLFSAASDLGGYDVWFPAIALSLVMIIGAVLEAVYAYLSNDPYSCEKKRLAEAYIAEDKQLYERVFFERAFSLEKSSKYERTEKDLDKRAVSSTFEINKLVAQLNGIVDPADAYDFCAIGRILDKELLEN